MTFHLLKITRNGKTYELDQTYPTKVAALRNKYHHLSKGRMSIILAKQTTHDGKYAVYYIPKRR